MSAKKALETDRQTRYGGSTSKAAAGASRVNLEESEKRIMQLIAAESATTVSEESLASANSSRTGFSLPPKTTSNTIPSSVPSSNLDKINSNLKILFENQKSTASRLETITLESTGIKSRIDNMATTSLEMMATLTDQVTKQDNLIEIQRQLQTNLASTNSKFDDLSAGILSLTSLVQGMANQRKPENRRVQTPAQEPASQSTLPRKNSALASGLFSPDSEDDVADFTSVLSQANLQTRIAKGHTSEERKSVVEQIERETSYYGIAVGRYGPGWTRMIDRLTPHESDRMWNSYYVGYLSASQRSQDIVVRNALIYLHTICPFCGERGGTLEFCSQIAMCSKKRGDKPLPPAEDKGEYKVYLAKPTRLVQGIRHSTKRLSMI